MVNRQSGLVTYTDRDLADSKNPLKIKEKPSPTWIQDLLSTVYFVRAQPLKEGDVIPVPISDGGEVYNIEVIAQTRRKARRRKVQAIQLNAKVLMALHCRSGEMLWAADDQTRVPLRARIKPQARQSQSI